MWISKKYAGKQKEKNLRTDVDFKEMWMQAKKENSFLRTDVDARGRN